MIRKSRFTFHRFIKQLNQRAALSLFLGTVWVLVGVPAYSDPLPSLPSGTVSKFYGGRNSSEARMTFDHWVLLDSETRPTRREAREAIESQINYLFGPMGAANRAAVPKGNHEISEIRVTRFDDTQHRYKIFYHYEGTIVIRRGGVRFQVVLPNDPSTIYESGLVLRRGASGKRLRYPCTDPHYTSEGDFWYFWNPSQRGCPLQLHEHYENVRARIQRIPNTRHTYPEYPRLVRDGVISISVLMGMDDPSSGRNPMSSRDLNALNYRDIRRSLHRVGFNSRVWSEDEIRAIAPRTPTGRLPYVEEFEKQNERARLEVRVFFGPSGIHEESRAFHYFFRDALERSSVMIYDGHSGLGGHLDWDSIEKREGFRIQPPRDYQIYFFNSCSSYPYYNTMFFSRKATSEIGADPDGTRNLDILTNGLATYFSVLHETNIALIRAIDSWASGGRIVTYQALANTIDSDNLFGINGDEDNPTRIEDVQSNIAR